MKALEWPRVNPAYAGTAVSLARRVILSIAGMVLALSACREPHTGGHGEAERVAVEPGRGIRFDPGTLRLGDTVGGLVADSVTVRRSGVDSTHVGSVVFRGRLQLSGRLMEHPESDFRKTAVCFEADSASAARMPRWRHDERRPWFCFVNAARARSALAASDPATGVAVVIEDFTIHRGLTDAVNSARFVDRVRR